MLPEKGASLRFPFLPLFFCFGQYRASFRTGQCRIRFREERQTFLCRLLFQDPGLFWAEPFLLPPTLRDRQTCFFHTTHRIFYTVYQKGRSYLFGFLLKVSPPVLVEPLPVVFVILLCLTLFEVCLFEREFIFRAVFQNCLIRLMDFLEFFRAD